MKDHFEQMLRRTLAPSEEPDACLNRNIVNSARKLQEDRLKNHSKETKNVSQQKGEIIMRKSWMKRMPAAAVAAAAIVLVGSLSAYAAWRWRYMSPEQAAVEVEDEKLAEAFQGEGAVIINESQSYGGYAITLLGMISGKNLSRFVYQSDDGEILTDRTYAVVAIENENGIGMPDPNLMRPVTEPEEPESFYVSPMIKGEDPRVTNINTMNGGCISFVKDGIFYRIVKCDNLEAFAGRGVYLGVTLSTLFEPEAFHFDKKTGEITRNEDYDGLNALFQLPLDVSKADEKAAQEQLRRWEEEMNSPENE